MTQITVQAQNDTKSFENTQFLLYKADYTYSFLVEYIIYKSPTSWPAYGATKLRLNLIVYYFCYFENSAIRERRPCRIAPAGRTRATVANPFLIPVNDMYINYLQQFKIILTASSLGAIFLLACTQDVERTPKASNVEHFTAAVEANPADPVLHHQLGMALALNQRLEEATAIYLRAIELDSTYALAHHGLGQLAAINGDLEGARSRFALAISADSTLAESHNDLGDVLRQLGDAEASLTAFEAATRYSPDEPLYHYNLGQLYLHLGRTADATGAIEHSVRLDGTFLPGHRSLARLHATAKRFDRAIQAYRRALTLAPDPESYTKLGDLYAEMMRFDDATREYEMALQIDSTYAFAEYGLGSVQAARGQLTEATERLDKAARIEPELTPALRALARIFMGKGRYDRAEEVLNRAIQQKDDEAHTHRMVGRLLTSLERFPRAEAALTKAIELAPQDAHALFLLASLYQKTERKAEAIDRLRQALQADPSHLEATHSLASMLQGTKGATASESERLMLRYEHLSGLANTEAKHRYQLRDNPDNAQARFGLAQTYMAMRKTGEAITQLRALLSTDPDHRNAGLQLCQLLAQSNDLESAIALANSLAQRLPLSLIHI